MSRFSRRAKLLSLAFIVIAGLYVAVLWRPGFSEAVPNDFNDARTKGALIAGQIVDITNQSSDDLKKINEFDKEQNITEALTLTTEVAKKSQDMRDLAIDLSNELTRMAQTLSDIKSPEARQAALESLSNRLALMSRLVNYSNYLGELLGTLQNRFTGSEKQSNEVARILESINAEVNAINNFNRQASDAMEKFDDLVKE